MVASFIAEENFEAYVAYQAQNDDGTNFTNYWDFLSAVAKTPGFCGGVAGAMYSRFEDAAMCAKELAGMVATLLTQTNRDDDTLVDGDGVEVPIEYQGLYVLNEPECDADNGGDTSSEFCQTMGGDTSQWPDFYISKNLDPNGELLVPRGAGYIYGPDMYYWFSQIVYGDSTITDAPSTVGTDPVAWWMSGMLTWMIPMNGKPSPHNIMLGQWEPTWAEAEYGITDGFGAVSALFYGEYQCGMSSHPMANMRTGIYEFLISEFNAEDGSWAAADTIYDWEANGCEGSSLAAFPDYGEYATIPQFATYTAEFEDFDGSTSTGISDTCWIVNYRTDYIVW